VSVVEHRSRSRSLEGQSADPRDRVVCMLLYNVRHRILEILLDVEIALFLILKWCEGREKKLEVSKGEEECSTGRLSSCQPVHSPAFSCQPCQEPDKTRLGGGQGNLCFGSSTLADSSGFQRTVRLLPR
jgi:hypothetical protein